MRYGSVCSGIESASAAWKRLGWKCVFVSEVEPFPCAVLRERLGATRPMRPLDPDAVPEGKERKTRESWKRALKFVREGGTLPNFGDFTKIEKKDLKEDIDLLVGGSPCQAFSVAGLRKGLEDARGNLTLEFARLAYRTRARWLVWENVPGVFTSGAEAILPPSYRFSAAGKCPFRKVDGKLPESARTPPAPSAWRGECLTLNIPEFPNFHGRSRSEGSVSSLSDVLVRGNVPHKYSLTASCAEGILRRAERKGKKMPEILRLALENLVGRRTPT